MDKETFLQSMRKTGNADILRALPELRGDKEVMFMAVSLLPRNLEYASEELKNDRDVVTAAVRGDGKLFRRYASKELQHDKEFILQLMKDFKITEFYIPSYHDKDKQFMSMYNYLYERNHVIKRMIEKHDPSLYDYEHIKDKDVMLVAISLDVQYFFRASKELQHDKEFILAVVNKNDKFLQYVSDEIKHDKDFMLYLLRDSRHGIYLFKYLPRDLKEDEDFIQQVIPYWRIQRDLYRPRGRVPILYDKLFAMTIMSIDPSVRFLSDELLSDEDVLLTAIQHCRTEDINSIVDYLPLERVNRNIAMELVLKKGTLISDMPQFNNDLFIAIAAISQDGNAVDSVSPELDIRGKLTELVDNHRKVMLLLHASKGSSSVEDESVQAYKKSDSEKSGLSKLSEHGPHYAQIFRKMIADFAGILMPPDFDVNLVMKAAKNLGIKEDIGGKRKNKNTRRKRKTKRK